VNTKPVITTDYDKIVWLGSSKNKANFIGMNDGFVIPVITGIQSF
jgi:hypothetical protein